MEISISKEDLLRGVQQYVFDHPTKAVATDTASQYQLEFDRITQGASTAEALEKLCNTRKKATFFKRKYALWYELSRRIQEQLREIEADPAVMDTLRRTEKLSRWLELGKAIDDLGPDCPIPAGQRQPRKSKRRDISGLPKDWRERLLDGMLGSKHYVPALVACVSGCRPSELQKSVSLRIENGTLKIRIKGAKTGAGKGQPRRVLKYDLPSSQQLVDDLATLVGLAGGELDVFIDNPKAFSSSITYYGHKLFPRSACTITPYCFRHQFASDAKRSFGDGDGVSAALGHRVDRTRSSYGQARMGKAGGGLAPSRVEATHEVRHVRTDPRRKPGQRLA